jgi:hypothetical protein
MLLSSETKSLEECINCLAHSREGTQEAIVQYRAQGAIHESEYMARVLQQDDYISSQDAKTPAASVPEKEVNLASFVFKNYLIITLIKMTDSTYMLNKSLLYNKI